MSTFILIKTEQLNLLFYIIYFFLYTLVAAIDVHSLKSCKEREERINVRNAQHFKGNISHR